MHPSHPIPNVAPLYALRPHPIPNVAPLYALRPHPLPNVVPLYALRGIEYDPIIIILFEASRY